jgi:hypothetical protein
VTEPLVQTARGTAAGLDVTGLELGISDFSLMRGGPLYRLASWVGLLRSRLGLVGPGVMLALATWAPLLVLSVIQRVAIDGSVTVPFLLDVSTHAHLLVAIPLLFAAEAWIDPRLQHFVQQVREARLVQPGELPILGAAVRRACRWRDSAAVEAIGLALAIALMASGFRVDLPTHVFSWWAIPGPAGPQLTLAGWWYTVVAVPIFQFLLFRWLWRLLIWSAFLYRLSRLDLQLVPTHPDLAGGLGYLGTVQSHFAALSFAASAVLAGIFAEQILYVGAHAQDYPLPVAGIVLINLLVFIGPLLFFGPRLLAVKRRGLREYGVLATGYVRDFDTKWLRGPTRSEEPILGTADLQSLADLGNSFEVIRHMRTVPFGPALVTSVVAASLAPMLPVLLTVFPLDELVLKVLKLLRGL